MGSENGQIQHLSVWKGKGIHNSIGVAMMKGLKAILSK